MEKQKLELYCVDIPVLMSSALTYRYCESKYSKVVAIIDKAIYEKRDMLGLVEKMKQSNIFYDVIQDRLFFDSNYEGTIEQYEQYVLEYYDKIFDRYGYCIEDFDNIVCFNDNWDGRINLYFNLKKKEYQWIQLDKNNLHEKTDERINANSIFYELMNKYKALSPFAPYAIPWRLSNCNQSLIEKLPRDVNIFDFEESIKEMPSEMVEKVVETYGISEILEICDSVLFIPNSYGYMYDRLTNRVKCVWDEFEYDEWIYYSLRVAADYLLNQDAEFLVKPHPNDPISEERLKIVMNDKTQILSYAPWEWLRRYLLINKMKVPKAIGIASTALDLLDSNICDNKIILGNSFMKTWFFWDSIYIALQVCKEINKPILANDYLMEQGKKIAEAKFLNIEFQFVNSKEREQQIIWIDAMEYPDNYILTKKLIEVENLDVVVLFNMDYTNETLEGIKKRYLSYINVEMIGCKNHLIDYGQKNTVWIYTKDEKIHCKIQSFCLEEKMFRRAGSLKANAIQRDKIKNWFEIQNERTQQAKLEKNFEIKQKQLPKLLWNSANSSISIASALKYENDIIVYLDMLQRLKHDYVILIAVKDTPGNCLDELTIEQLKNLGFKSFSKELWRMYTGISLNEDVVIDHVADQREEQVNEKMYVSGHDISLWSKAWRNGNQASIKVDGIEYAINKRGINIVVYDPNRDCVIDSIAYDAHTNDKIFYR